MRNMIPRWQPLLIACAVGIAIAVPAPAEEAPAAAPANAKVLDRQINEMLKVIINTGALIHNGAPKRGIPHNPAGCYLLYHDFLQALRPLLGHHPDLQKAIDAGLAKAEGMPAGTIGQYSDRAFVLRQIIDTIRSATGRASLWDRLGGEANVRKVVADFVARAAKDPKVNFFRGTAFKDKVNVPEFKKRLMELISVVSGGPYAYSGRSMKEVHKGMGITGAEFDALAVDLAEALAKHGAQPADIDAVIAAVELTRKDIVEEKTGPAEKKRDDKKPEEKKAQEKPGKS